MVYVPLKSRSRCGIHRQKTEIEKQEKYTWNSLPLPYRGHIDLTIIYLSISRGRCSPGVDNDGAVGVAVGSVSPLL